MNKEPKSMWIPSIRRGYKVPTMKLSVGCIVMIVVFLIVFAICWLWMNHNAMNAIEWEEEPPLADK